MFLCVLFGASPRLRADDEVTKSLFAAVPFDRWEKEGPRQPIAWRVRIQPGRLSLHQRLRARIEVQVSGADVVKRRGDGRVVFLLQVTDEAGNSFRNYGRMEGNNFHSDLAKGDVVIAWEAFVLPGKYQVEIALFDKETEEHNFARARMKVDGLKKDPLPGAWQGLPSVEFWAPETAGLDELYRSDMDGRLHLPAAASRPVHLTIFADLTPAQLFAGNQKLYELYLAGALPMVKALSQIQTAGGSPDVEGIDLYQSKAVFEQSDAEQLDWPRLKAALAPDKGPAVVHVNTLQQHDHSPVFLREEIARRLEAPGAAGGPVQVCIVIGQNMDSYTFPSLPPIANAGRQPCAVFYLQYGVSGTEHDGLHKRGMDGNLIHLGILFGDADKVVRMLQPLPVRTFQVASPESFRRALARILEEISHM